jgi:hypothetical protein
MTALRRLFSAAMLTFGLTLPCHAESCDAILTKLGSQVPALSVAEKRTDNNLSVVITLKHPDVGALSITCPADETSRSPLVAAQWNATWPPARFYDLLATVGAVVVSNTEPAIRSGAILCTQRAMNENGQDVYDANGARFKCTSSNGVNGSTAITISKLNDTQPQ